MRPVERADAEVRDPGSDGAPVVTRTGTLTADRAVGLRATMTTSLRQEAMRLLPDMQLRARDA